MNKLPTKPIRRRNILKGGVLTVAALPVALGGCGLVSTNSPFWATVASSVPGEQPAPVTRERADSLPYASILAWFEGSAKAFMVLGEVRQDDQLVWFSASREVIVTQGPFVVQTAGMEKNLSGLRFDNDQVPVLTGASMASAKRLIDVEGLLLFDWPLRSDFAPAGREEVEILGKTYGLVKVAERVRPETADAWTNEYWLNPETGFCWKSRQKLFPGLPFLNIEILKPFAPA